VSETCVFAGRSVRLTLRAYQYDSNALVRRIIAVHKTGDLGDCAPVRINPADLAYLCESLPTNTAHSVQPELSVDTFRGLGTVRVIWSHTTGDGLPRDRVATTSRLCLVAAKILNRSEIAAPACAGR
jgi:hypothetical protein